MMEKQLLGGIQGHGDLGARLSPWVTCLKGPVKLRCTVPGEFLVIMAVSTEVAIACLYQVPEVGLDRSRPAVAGFR